MDNDIFEQDRDFLFAEPPPPPKKNVPQRVVVILLCVLFVLTTPLTFLASIVELTYFDTQPFKDAIEELNLYQKLPVIIARQTHHQINLDPSILEGSGIPDINEELSLASPYLRSLSVKDFEILSQLLLPTDWIELKTENALEQYYASMAAGIAEPDVRIAMSDIKSRLQGQIGEIFFLTMIRAHPACTPEQLMVWQSADYEEPPQCFPGEVQLHTALPKLRPLIGDMVEEIPDEISLSYMLSVSKTGKPTITTNIQHAITNAWDWRMLLRFSPFLVIIFLIAIGLAASNSQWVTKAFGFSLIGAGLLGFLLAGLLWPLLSLVLKEIVFPQVPAFVVEDLVFVGTDILHIFSRQISLYLTASSGMAAILGIFWLLAPRLGGLQKKKVVKKSVWSD